MRSVFILVCDDRDHDSGEVRNIAAFEDEAVADALAAQLDTIAQGYTQADLAYTREHKQHHPDRRALEHKACEDMAALLVQYPDAEIHRDYNPPRLCIDVMAAGFTVQELKVH